MPAEEQRHDDIHETWPRVCEALRAELADRPFKTWIVPIRPISADADCVVLACTTATERDRVAGTFGVRIADLLAHFSKLERRVDFVVDVASRSAGARLAAISGDGVPPSLPDLVPGSVPIDPAYAFANFVTGPSNQTAYNVARDVAMGREVHTSPLFIFGPTGTGKSHLLHAAIRSLSEREPSIRVLHLTSEAFVAGFLSSLRNRDTQAFKDLVRNVDVLVVDDLQFLSGKIASMEEFFHTLDDLSARGKQVIVAADRSPALFEQMPERLRSRLVNGGGVEIGPADFDLRLAILQSKAARLAQERPGLAIGEDVLRMMAARIQADARVLDGALKRIALQSGFGTEPVTFARAEAWLADFLRAHNKHVSLNEIGSTVARDFGVTPQDLSSTCRRREFVLARQVAMFISRKMTPRSFPEIGKHFRKDHTTVMHGCQKVSKLYASDPRFKTRIDALQRSIRDWSRDPDDNNTTK